MPSYPSGTLCGAVHCSAAIGHRHRRATLQARQCRRPMTAGVAITLIVVRSCEVITCLGLLAAVPAPPKKRRVRAWLRWCGVVWLRAFFGGQARPRAACAHRCRRAPTQARHHRRPQTAPPCGAPASAKPTLTRPYGRAPTPRPNGGEFF